MPLKKLVVPLDNPQLVFTVDTDASDEDLIMVLQEEGVERFQLAFPHRLVESQGFPNLNEAYVINGVSK
jgi:hypothetical protein